MSGDIEPDHVIYLLAQHFTDLGRERSPIGIPRPGPKDWPITANLEIVSHAALAWPANGLHDDPERTAAQWLALYSLIDGPHPALAQLWSGGALPGGMFVSLGLVGLSWDATSPTALCLGATLADGMPAGEIDAIMRAAVRAGPGLADEDAALIAAERLLLSDMHSIDDPVRRTRRIGVHTLFGGDLGLALDPSDLWERVAQPALMRRAWRALALSPPALIVAGVSR